ncbi:hypothetical protein Gogos_015393, partial [Gossypium gossypioides]|nr:hypothetical protein [Gossypium gossypioides]
MEITERDGSDEGDLVNRSTKKVRIQDIEENQDVDMETTTVAGKTLSWKDRLLGIGLYPNERTTNTEGIEEDEDFELSEEDVERSSTNGFFTLETFLTIPSNGHGKWTMDFNPAQPYPSIVMAWIHLLGLPGHMYKRQVLREIGGMIRKVTNLDFNTNNGDNKGGTPDPCICGPWMLVERKGRRIERARQKDGGDV